MASKCRKTIDVIIARAEPLGIEVEICKYEKMNFEDTFGCIIQYPNRFGVIDGSKIYQGIVDKAHKANCKVIFATDLMCLQLFEAPGCSSRK